MTRTVAVVSAGLSTPSSTKLLAERLGQAVEAALAAAGDEALVEHVELRPLAHPLADHLLTGFPSAELEAALATVRGADALVAVSPVFAASYSGLFKSFVDVLEPDDLAGTPVLLAATGGTARHSLVLEHAMRPLFSYLRALVVPTAVYAATEDFGATAATALSERTRRAADELAALLVGGASKPRPADPFEDVVPFERLLEG